PQLPLALSVRAEDLTTTHVDDDPEHSAKVVCGFLGLDARPFNPLLASLPRVLRIPGSTLAADSWFSTLMRAVVAEADAKRPGGEAVLARMSEMLFVEALRRYGDSLPVEETGWRSATPPPPRGGPRALADPRTSPTGVDGRAPERGRRALALVAARAVHAVDRPAADAIPDELADAARIGPAQGHERQADAGGAGRGLRER